MTSVTAQILDGTATAKAIKGELTERVAKLKERGVVPGLGTVLVGDDPGSRWYVNGKHKDCAEVGIESIRVDLPETASQAEVEEHVARLNADPACTGYIVQLPLPTHMDANRVLSLIDPDKDADGLHPTNLGWLVLGKDAPLPCTPYGIVELLRRHDVPIAGADVPGIITGAMVKPGAAVLDVGVSRVDGKLAGDVAQDVYDVAAWVSPNPGGVGPMTRAMLLSNIVSAAEQSLAQD